MPVHDLRGSTPEKLAAAIAALRRRLSSGRREPAQWPPYSVEVCLCPDSSGQVHMDIDGLVTDGHSIALLLDQWARPYHDPAMSLPPVRVTGRDCVLAMAAQSTGQRRDRDLSYWLERLHSTPPGPTFGEPYHWVPPPRNAGYDRDAYEGRLDPRTWSALRAHAASIGVSPSSLVLSSFTEALARAGATRPFSLVLTTSARTWLPDDATQVVGPFTSSAIIVADADPAESPRTAARALHRQVWSALDHAGVSSVDALRVLRARGEVMPDTPSIVFTSLLDLGPDRRVDGGFGADVGYAVCHTSDIALEHQMWEERGGLRFRWDCAAARFPAGTIDTAIAAFTNGLHGLVAIGDTGETRPPNPLQQSYIVARSARTEPWDGYQIYKTMCIDDLGLTRLHAAVVELIEANDALCSWIDHDGMVHTTTHVPASWQVPVIELADQLDPADTWARLRDDMAGRAFPLGRWPHFDIRVTVGAGRPTVHCAFDIAVFDAPSVHFVCRELLRRYADPLASGDPRPPGYRDEPEPGAAERDSARAHWERRAATVPAGPGLPATPARAGASQPGRRVRLLDRLHGWRAVTADAAARGDPARRAAPRGVTQVLADELGTADSRSRWCGGTAGRGRDRASPPS
jgi:condensation domain-containing protein